jgi:hypothetical protein
MRKEPTIGEDMWIFVISSVCLDNRKLAGDPAYPMGDLWNEYISKINMTILSRKVTEKHGKNKYYI